MRMLPTTYETFKREGWEIAVSSRGMELPGSNGELAVKMQWLAVATRLPLQVSPREPRVFSTREAALDALFDALATVEAEGGVGFA